MDPDARGWFPRTEPPQVVGVAGREEKEKGEVKGAQSKLEVPFAFRMYQSQGKRIILKIEQKVTGKKLKTFQKY